MISLAYSKRKLLTSASRLGNHVRLQMTADTTCEGELIDEHATAFFYSPHSFKTIPPKNSCLLLAK
jgi:hypothetical protein